MKGPRPRGGSFRVSSIFLLASAFVDAVMVLYFGVPVAYWPIVNCPHQRPFDLKTLSISPGRWRKQHSPVARSVDAESGAV